MLAPADDVTLRAQPRRAALLVATVIRPSTWVALAVLAVPLGSQSSPGGPTATPSDAALIVAVVFAFVAVLRGQRSTLGAHALACARSVPAVGLLVVGVVSAAVTVVANNYPASLIGGIRFLELFVLGPFAVMVSMRSRRDAMTVLGSLVGLALAEGAFGLWQSVTGHGASINGADVRAVGTFGAYNIESLAELCGLALIASLAVAVVTEGRTRWLAAAATVFLCLPLAASMSRGMYVAAVVAAVVVISRGRPGRLVAVVAIAGLAAALVVPPLVASGTGLGNRVGSLISANADPDQSVKDRLALWAAARDMAVDHPLSGVGPRAFPDHRDPYAGLSLLGSSDISIGSNFQQVALDSPHDLYLLIASEQGLVALAAYGTLFALVLARALVISSRRRSDASTALALVAAGMLATLLVMLISGDLGGPGSIFIAFTVGVAARAAVDLDLVGHGIGWMRSRARTFSSAGARTERGITPVPVGAKYGGSS